MPFKRSLHFLSALAEPHQVTEHNRTVGGHDRAAAFVAARAGDRLLDRRQPGRQGDVVADPIPHLPLSARVQLQAPRLPVAAELRLGHGRNPKTEHDLRLPQPDIAGILRRAGRLDSGQRAAHPPELGPAERQERERAPPQAETAAEEESRPIGALERATERQRRSEHQLLQRDCQQQQLRADRQQEYYRRWRRCCGQQ